MYKKLDQEQCDLLARRGYPELGRIINFVASRCMWLETLPRMSNGELVYLDDRLEAAMLVSIAEEHCMILRGLL